MKNCKHIHREGSSCSINNNCRYPECVKVPSLLDERIDFYKKELQEELSKKSTKTGVEIVLRTVLDELEPIKIDAAKIREDEAVEFHWWMQTSDIPNRKRWHEPKMDGSDVDKNKKIVRDLYALFLTDKNKLK